MDMPSYQGSGNNNNLSEESKKGADLQVVHKSLESIQGADPTLPDSAHNHSGSIGDGDSVSEGVHAVAENQRPPQWAWGMTGSLRNGIRNLTEPLRNGIRSLITEPLRNGIHSLTEPLGREERNPAETDETDQRTSLVIPPRTRLDEGVLQGDDQGPPLVVPRRPPERVPQTAHQGGPPEVPPRPPLVVSQGDDE